jgi:hypothetical protein
VTPNYDALELAADPGLTIIAYTAEAGSPTQNTLCLLLMDKNRNSTKPPKRTYESFS